MTLVVGWATPDIGFLVADTLLSFPFELKGHVGPVNGRFHTLKIQILNANVAVAFAGDAAASCRLIRALHTRITADPAIDPCAQLLALYNGFDAVPASDPLPEYEFLILQLTPRGLNLAKVTRHGVFHCQRTHIGDDLEYKRMRELQRPYVAPVVQHFQQSDGTFRVMPLILTEGETEFAKMSDAMEALTQSRRSESVGAIAGCITRVVNARISGELEYLQSVEASLTPWEGVSGFSVLASNSGTRGVGIYYRTGRMGFLFAVGDDQPCRKEYAQTIEDFVRVARSKYGLDLT